MSSPEEITSSGQITSSGDMASSTKVTSSTVQASIVRHLVLDKLTGPAVFRGMIDSSWSCRDWTLQQWADRFDRKPLRFRQPPQSPVASVGPLWEGQCRYTSATLGDFVRWLQESNNTQEHCLGPPPGELPAENWAYADYMHLAKLFESDESDCDVIKSVDWSSFGFEGRDGADSALWVGSRGAHTPCHYDTYGCNLVAQLIGRKRWVLFPPDDTDNMYPTRIPYEESSVFSQVDVGNPQLRAFPRFTKSKPHIVTLQPGDVLFVPHKWWHYAHALSTSLSINTWIELDIDDTSRLEESVSRTTVTALMCPCDQADHDQHKDWINPTEEYTSSDTNVKYVSQMLEVLQRKANSSVTGSDTNLSKLSPSVLSLVDQRQQKEQEENGQINSSNGEPAKKKTRFSEHDMTLISQSTFEQYLSSTEDTKRKNLTTNSDLLENDNFRNRLCNAISHPDVVKLICEKLRENS